MQRYPFIILSESETPNECPVTHPYAFKQGRNCCKYDTEDDHTSFFRHPHPDSTCNGGNISIYSNCCKDAAFVRCTDGRFCTNGNENGGEFSINIYC